LGVAGELGFLDDLNFVNVRERAVLPNVSRAAEARAAAKTTALVPYWPANRGFLGQSQRDFLMPGMQIDRYGGNAGKFVAPSGTPFEARSLPAQYLHTKPYNAFEVLKPIEVDAGITAPALGQRGLGVQYELPVSIDVLIKRGFLKPINP